MPFHPSPRVWLRAFVSVAVPSLRAQENMATLRLSGSELDRAMILLFRMAYTSYPLISELSIEKKRSLKMSLFCGVCGT